MASPVLDRHFHRERVLGPDAGLDLLQIAERPNQQPRGRKDDDSCGHLGHDEPALQPARAGDPAARLDERGTRAVGLTERRRVGEDQRRRGGDEHGERQHAQVDADFIGARRKSSRESDQQVESHEREDNAEDRAAGCEDSGL